MGESYTLGKLRKCNNEQLFSGIIPSAYVAEWVLAHGRRDRWSFVHANSFEQSEVARVQAYAVTYEVDLEPPQPSFAFFICLLELFETFIIFSKGKIGEGASV